MAEGSVRRIGRDGLVPGGGTPGSTPTQGAPLLPPILPPLLPSPSSSPAPLPLPTCILGTSPLGLPLCK